MKSTTPTLFALFLSFLASVEATPTPQLATKACGAASCPAAAVPQKITSAFGGMPKRAFTVRGGEVLEANTQEEMDSILIRSAGSLVVVDHWAT